MRVLGVDPGSRRTGWGVIERRGRELHHVASGHCAAGARLALPARLHALALELDGVIARYAPECVVIESAFHHAFARSTLVLGHVRGALMLTAMDRGLPVAEYAPRAIKLAVIGNGAAAKQQVQAMVKHQLGLSVLPQADAADALAGALCHLRRARYDAPRRRTPANDRLRALLATARGGRW